MTTYYISTSGSDTNNGTALLTPFRSIAKARGLVNPGDTVYIRGGTYSGIGINPSTAIYYNSYTYYGWVELNRSGTAIAPITWSNYDGEQVIIDGLNSHPNVGFEIALINVAASYNNITGITIRNSYSLGIKLQGTYNKASFITVENCRYMGLYLQGNYNTCEDCIVRECSRFNYQGVGYATAQWTYGMGCGRNYGQYDSLGRQVTIGAVIRRCTSYHNWGEGIGLFEATDCLIEDCVSYDNFAVNLYLSNAERLVCQRNLVYATNYSHPTTTTGYVGRARGIAISNENATYNGATVTATPQMNDVKVLNNLIIGTGGNICSFQYGSGSHTCTNLLVANNVSIESQTPSMGWGGCNLEFVTGMTYTGSRFTSNIIIQSTNNDIVKGSAGGITCDHNIWSRTQSIYVGTGDYTGDPQLALTGWDGNGGTLTKEYFRPIASSASLAKAAVIAANPLDFESVTRSGTTPTAGALETPVGGSGVTDWSNTIAPWTSTVVGDTYAAAVVQRSQSTNAIKIVSSGGSDIYGTADGFSSAYQSASGDFDVRCRIQSATGGAQYAKVGIDVRQSLTAGSAHYGLMKQRNTAGSDVLTMYQFSRYTVDGTTSATLVPASETINFVRARRIGSLLEFMYSSDGNTWTTQSSLTLSGWAETVYVCLSVCSASLVSATTAILDNISMVQSLPAPWIYSDVGAVGVVGSATYSAGSYVVYSGGSAIWDATDSFGFVNRQKSGDLDLRVRVPVGPSNTSNWAKAGLMVRSTMAVGASFFCIDIQPTGVIEILYRPYPDGSNAAFMSSVTSAAKYLRITRAGDTFSAYYSTDGSSWTSLGTQLSITMPSTVYVGPFVHSNDVLYLSSATFDGLTIADTVSTQANLFFMDL